MCSVRSAVANRSAAHADYVQAAKYEVFVTQPPDQDPHRCFERNVHGRTAQDVFEASRALEPSPATATKLNCAAIVPNSATDNDSPRPPLPSDCATLAADSPQSTETKRKSMDIGSVGGGDEKRARVGGGPGAIDDSQVLAMVDAGFSERPQPGNSQGSKKTQKQGGRSRWSDDDESEDEGASRWQVRSGQNSQQTLRGAAGTSGGVGAYPPPPLHLILTLRAVCSVPLLPCCQRLS